MRRFQVTYHHGAVEIVEADACLPNAWSVSFAYVVERESRSFNAKPGDTVEKLQTFRVISGSLVADVRQIP